MLLRVDNDCYSEMQHAGHKRSASEREATDEDFFIHSSQSYMRTASQSIQGSAPSQVHAMSQHATGLQQQGAWSADNSAQIVSCSCEHA